MIADGIKQSDEEKKIWEEIAAMGRRYKKVSPVPVEGELTIDTYELDGETFVAPAPRIFKHGLTKKEFEEYCNES